jgi:hypothetical protein
MRQPARSSNRASGMILVKYVPDIPVFAEGWLLYAIASPLPQWVEVVLHFSRLNLPEPPTVTVEPLP